MTGNKDGTKGARALVILTAACSQYGVALADALSASRRKTFVYARHVSMYLCREILKDLSWYDIADAHSREDHTLGRPTAAGLYFARLPATASGLEAKIVRLPRGRCA